MFLSVRLAAHCCVPVNSDVNRHLEVDMSSDESAIRELVAEWLSATKAGDMATILSLMTDDVVFLVPGKEPFGKSAFTAALPSQAQHSVSFDGSSEILDLKVAGDWAFMISKLRVTASQPGTPPVTRAGHTLTVLYKQGGKWRVRRDANLLMPVGSGDDA